MRFEERTLVLCPWKFSFQNWCPAPHLDNSHTIELMMDNVSLKVSNSADPFLLQQIIRMLCADQC